MIAISIISVAVLFSRIVSTAASDTKRNDTNPNTEYKGQKFPLKYLDPDPIQPSLADLNVYLDVLDRTLAYFIKLNDSDVNIAVGSYFCKAGLKRAILNHGDKLVDIGELSRVKDLIRKAEVVVDQRSYINLNELDRAFYRISTVLRFDDALVHSMGNFNRNKFDKYIFTNNDLNEHLEAIDNASLEKSTYIDLIVSMHRYYVTIDESDLCLSNIAYTQEPTSASSPFSRCRPDPFCEDVLHGSPSVAYSLSHRHLNIMMRLLSRRCYMQSEEFDRAHLDYLCSFMYREAVYTARRGFFSRDTFLEHILLCGLGGYEEFFRTSWFRKSASWVDENGCMTEFSNFEINRTKIYLSRSHTTERNNAIRDALNWTLRNKCHHHPMALLVGVLGLAIRHAVYYLSKSQLT